MKKVIIVTAFIAFASNASAEGLKAMWRSRQVVGQIGKLENAIQTHHRNVELSGSWSHRDVGRLRSSSQSLAKTLQGMRDAGQPVPRELQSRLEAIQMPSFRASIGVSKNLWGQEGFDPSDVSAVEHLSAMTSSYSALFKIADTMGIRMKSMNLKLGIPYQARITRQGDEPGVNVELTR
jgi:hypothetical protein